MRTQQREAARAAILDAAEELIAAKGLTGSALVQIAERAGVAVGTLYNYFADRDDLIRALFEHRRATLRPLLRVAGAGPDAEALPFAARARAFVHDVLAALESHRRFVKIALEHEHVRPAGGSAPNDLLTAATALVDAGIAEGSVDPAHRELLPAMFVGAVKAVVLRRIAAAGALTADADTIATLLLDGARIRTRA